MYLLLIELNHCEHSGHICLLFTVSLTNATNLCFVSPASTFSRALFQFDCLFPGECECQPSIILSSHIWLCVWLCEERGPGSVSRIVFCDATCSIQWSWAEKKTGQNPWEVKDKAAHVKVLYVFVFTHIPVLINIDSEAVCVQSPDQDSKTIQYTIPFRCAII